MKECNCETLLMSDVEQTEERKLRHRECGGVFDPAMKLVREQRNDPAGPHMPNVEYRDGMEMDDGT